MAAVAWLLARRIGGPLLAATTLMVLAYVSVVIIATASTILGFRTDQPTLLRVQGSGLWHRGGDNCAEVVDLRLRAAAPERHAALCETVVDVVAGGREGESLVLLVNGEQSRNAPVLGGKATFGYVQLESGDNFLEVATRSGLEHARIGRRPSREFDSQRTPYGAWPRLQNRSRAMVRAPGLRPAVVSQWRVGSGFAQLITGNVGDLVDTTCCGPRQIEADGFLVARTIDEFSALPRLVETTGSLRSVVVTKADEGVVIEARLRLPSSHPVLSGPSRRDARRFAERMLGVHIVADDDTPAELRRIDGPETGPAQGAEFTLRLEAKGVRIGRYSSTFLEAPGDELKVVGQEGFGWFDGPSPAKDADGVTWKGPLTEWLDAQIGTPAPVATRVGVVGDDEPEEAEAPRRSARTPQDLQQAVSLLPSGLPRAVAEVIGAGAPLVAAGLIWFASRGRARRASCACAPVERPPGCSCWSPRCPSCSPSPSV